MKGGSGDTIPANTMRDKNFDVSDLQAVLGDINDSIILLSQSGELIWSNKAYALFAEDLGIDPDKNFFDFFEENSDFDLSVGVQQASAMDTTCRFELFFHTFRKWFLLHITVLQVGITIRFEKITVEKQEAETPEKHVLIDERNLRILINITDHPIWLVDMNKEIVLCNTAFKKWILNFSGKELGVGDSILDKGLDAVYLEKIRACYELAFTGKNFTAIEDIKVGDEIKFTTINFNPVFDNNNVLAGISCHATDITDHRKNLSKIESQTQLLMEIANIQSHKVRGPLATLLGLVHVFNYEEVNDPNNVEVMNGVAEVAGKLDQIVTDVIRSINLLSFRTGKAKDGSE